MKPLLIDIKQTLEQYQALMNAGGKDANPQILSAMIIRDGLVEVAQYLDELGFSERCSDSPNNVGAIQLLAHKLGDVAEAITHVAASMPDNP